MLTSLSFPPPSPFPSLAHAHRNLAHALGCSVSVPARRSLRLQSCATAAAGGSVGSCGAGGGEEERDADEYGRQRKQARIGSQHGVTATAVDSPRSFVCSLGSQTPPSHSHQHTFEFQYTFESSFISAPLSQHTCRLKQKQVSQAQRGSQHSGSAAGPIRSRTSTHLCSLE